MRKFIKESASIICITLFFFIIAAPQCIQNQCINNEDCFLSSYCKKETGDCEGLGDCEARPDACIEIFQPVCGCDGETYSNECKAASFGITVFFEGSCDEVLCDTSACGPAPGMPNYLCSDGTLAGPTGRCLRHTDGICGWEIRDCP